MSTKVMKTVLAMSALLLATACNSGDSAFGGGSGGGGGGSPASVTALGVTGILLRNSSSYFDNALALFQGFAIVFVVMILMLMAARRQKDLMLQKPQLIARLGEIEALEALQELQKELDGALEVLPPPATAREERPLGALHLPEQGGARRRREWSVGHGDGSFRNVLPPRAGPGGRRASDLFHDFLVHDTVD